MDADAERDANTELLLLRRHNGTLIYVPSLALGLLLYGLSLFDILARNGTVDSNLGIMSFGGLLLVLAGINFRRDRARRQRIAELEGARRHKVGENQ